MLLNISQKRGMVQMNKNYGMIPTTKVDKDKIEAAMLAFDKSYKCRQCGARFKYMKQVVEHRDEVHRY